MAQAQFSPGSLIRARGRDHTIEKETCGLFSGKHACGKTHEIRIRHQRRQLIEIFFDKIAQQESRRGNDRIRRIHRERTKN